MANTVDFDLTKYIELGEDFSTVCLWKIQYGTPYNTNNNPKARYVLALTAEHAIAISNQYTQAYNDELGDDSDKGWPDPILSVEAVSANIWVDSRFVNSTGIVECPPKESSNG